MCLRLFDTTASSPSAICYHPWRPGGVARMSYEEAYPNIEFSRRSRNWWAWLKGSAPECIHLDQDTTWMVTVLPDTVYLRGKKAFRRDTLRPEASLCRACLAEAFTPEIAAYQGRVVAFEPDPEIFTQYFFLAEPDFVAAGLSPEVSEAIEKRLAQPLGECERCSRAATWLWLSRQEVASLDETEQIAEAKGEAFCAEHGAWKLWETFSNIPEANLFYMNLPYGEAGAYVWI